MERISKALSLVAGYADSAGVELVQRAYNLSTPSSLPGIEPPLSKKNNHAAAAAIILAELEARAESVAAALLVDCQNNIPLDSVQEQLGERVSSLVDGVQQMRQLPYLSSLNKHAWTGRERSELYHAFVAALDDPQVILIELAHQLNKLRHLSELSPAEQLRTATEALQIYAPLAHRLGIWRIKWQLEDKAFNFSHPKEYREIAEALDEQRSDREMSVQRTARVLEEELNKDGIAADISGRPKHIFSIYRKMQRKAVSFDAIYDVQAIRVIVNDVPSCYAVLGIVHKLWTPIPGQFDDYIAAPKRNGYRSLHTAVVVRGEKTMEVQIRSHAMHQRAELGIAAHWRYKERGDSKHTERKKRASQADHALDERISWLRSLLEIPAGLAEQATDSSPDFDMDSRPIFVLTPMGDLVRLPAGATPIDFAYRIHTELGHQCYGAKVNDHIVPLNHQLASGDIVEIITRKRGGPNIDWLSLDRGFVKTKEAQKKISSWFRRQKREENIVRGHELLERVLAKHGVKSLLSFDQVAKLLKQNSTDEMLAQIGSGAITQDKIQSAILRQTRLTPDERAREAEKELVTEEGEIKTLIEQPPSERIPKEPVPGLQVASTEGLYVRFARCCCPVPDEEIVGYVTRGHGVTIHLKDCPNILSTSEKERLVPATWGIANKQVYPVAVIGEAINRRGLMADLGQAVAKENIDIREAKVKRKAHWALFELLLDINNADQLARVLENLTQTRGVRQVYRRIG